jgi:isoamylase
MSDDDWEQDHAKCCAVFLNGDVLRDVNEGGDPVHDDSVLLLFNAHNESVRFTMPSLTFGAVWHAVLDTSSDSGDAVGEVAANETLEVEGRTVIVLARAAGQGNDRASP